MAKRPRRTPDYSIFEDFDSLLRNVNIDEKTWLFFQNYTNPEAQGFDNITKAYIDAGYSDNSSTKYAAVKHFNRPLFQRLLLLYKQKQAENKDNRELTALEYTRNELKLIIETAKDKKDISNWRGAVMDLAKLDGLLAERLIVGRDDTMTIDANMRQAALDLANRALLPGCQDAAKEAIDSVIPQSGADTIDAQFVDDQGDQDSSTEPVIDDDWFLSDGDNSAGDTQDMV